MNYQIRLIKEQLNEAYKIEWYDADKKLWRYLRGSATTDQETAEARFTDLLQKGLDLEPQVLKQGVTP